MADDELTPDPVVEDDPDTEEIAELASEIQHDAKGNKMVSLSTMLKYKKEAKALGKKIKELEPVAARVAEIDQKLEQVSPLVNAILTNPKLKAEAIRVANGTRTSADTTVQPTDEEDPDAAGYAEDMGFYLSDNTTPDVARARRVLDRMDARHKKQTDDRMRPWVGRMVGDAAGSNLAKAIATTDQDGTPYATEESIREAAAQMGQDGQHLLANPQVIELVLDRAMGIDRRKGRTPKAADEPLYMDRAASGRRSAQPVISGDERRSLEKLGISDKEYEEAGKQLATGRAVVFKRT